MSHVLIVDDSRTIRMQVRTVLEQEGLQVTEAADGKIALGLAPGLNPDLIITDLNMPEMDGISLVRALRGNASFPRIPILILTTVTDQEMKDKGRAAGATGWLCKPFKPDQLKIVIQKVLGK
jgi:two-component system chemotaxis response regulator CheY